MRFGGLFFRGRCLLPQNGFAKRGFYATGHQRLPKGPRTDADEIPLAEDIRLEDARIKLPWHNVEGTTITHREREVFERLFQNVVKDAAAKESVLARKAKNRSTVNDKGQTVKSRNELVQSVSQFPEALRDIALNTAEKIERNAWQARYDKENETIALSPEIQQQAAEARAHQEKEFDRIKTAMQHTDTDFALWEILEKELFAKFADLHVQEAAAMSTKANQASASAESMPLQSEDVSGASSASVTDVLRFGMLYPAALTEAVHAWRERFPLSTMPLSVLPRLKQLGRASYALGASASLYHQIMHVTWVLTGDFSQVTKLLQEMDDAGIDFSEDTLEVFDQIQGHWRDRWRGASSKAAAAAYRMELVTEGYNKFRQWRSTIEGRLDASALRQANQKIAQHVLE